jgi:hypothetical protein
MDNITLLVAKESVLKHWKLIALIAVGIGTGLYITFLHHVIKTDNEMLAAAQNQMASMSAEYRTNILTLGASVMAQNKEIDRLQKAGKVAEQSVTDGEKVASTIRAASNAKVNVLLARKEPVTCDDSIKDAINSVYELSWENAK